MNEADISCISSWITGPVVEKIKYFEKFSLHLFNTFNSLHAIFIAEGCMFIFYFSFSYH